jgi:two-component system, LytTR family, sensor kinase
VRVRLRLRPWMLVSAAWIGPAILGGIDVIVQQRIYGDGPVPIRAVIFVTGDWLLYGLLTPAVFAIARTWPLARPHLFGRAVLHLVFSLLFCAAWAGSGTILKALVDPRGLASSGGAAVYFVSWVFITLPFGVAVYLAVVGTEHAIRYFDEAREREIQLARLSEQLSGARFEALQAQLNPHFLFNTLNTVAVLVRDGDKTAARIVEQLSDVLRRTLTRHRTPEVTLAEELDLVRQYLAIEQARFSDRLRPVFAIDEHVLSAAVPGFAL